MNEGVLAQKAYALALRVVRLTKHIRARDAPSTLCSQLLRSGTSVGANVEEAGYGQSTPDFISKLSIARKEARETGYWLRLLHDAGYLEAAGFKSVHADCEEVLRLLTSSIKTAQSRLPAKPTKPTSH